MNTLKNTKLTLRDKLAIERTNLAVERTFLAYFRSSLFFFATGLSILKIHFFKQIDFLGTLLIVISPILLIIGFYSFFIAKKNIKNYLID